MALVTSEGNARKTIAATDTRIAVAGVEKVTPTVEDLQPFVELIGRSGTGQDITSYISVLMSPVESPTIDFDDGAAAVVGGSDDREFHLVVLDNGRLSMREDDDLRETLYCIRCSACSDVCANFQQVRPRLRRGDILRRYRDRVGGRHRGPRHGRRVQRPLYRLFAVCRRLSGEDRHPVDQHGRPRPDQPRGRLERVRSAR
jgi:hypothetical protein